MNDFSEQAQVNDNANTRVRTSCRRTVNTHNLVEEDMECEVSAHELKPMTMMTMNLILANFWKLMAMPNVTKELVVVSQGSKMEAQTKNAKTTRCKEHVPT